MAKILAAVSFILSASETALSIRWFAKAKERDWDPKRIFYGIVWLLSAVMQMMLACDLLTTDAECISCDEADWDDFDDFKDC